MQIWIFRTKVLLMNNPVIYTDRMAVAGLRSEDTRLHEIMRAHGIGKLDSQQTVHFCGLVREGSERSAVFLPRSVRPKTMDTARLTIRALSRYGQNAENRAFSTDGDNGNPGALAVIRKLAEDFQAHGLFVERQRIRSRNAGKPDWVRTVTRERAYAGENSGDVFSDIATTRSVDSSETLLAQVQAVVLQEIISDHGWWLEGARARRAELVWQKKPRQPRAIWALLLDGLLPQLYSARSIFLATYLAHYLRECRASDAGSFVFGVEDFHTVWERMLDETLSGVEHGWNKRLPRAVYERDGGKPVDAPERRMLTDTVLRTSSGYSIVDAKYYGGTSQTNVPGWPDVAKQMFYEMALRSVVGDSALVRNCFVFPGHVPSGTGYSTVRMRTSVDGFVVASFPTVECLYMDIREVMEAYCEGRSDLHLPCPASDASMDSLVGAP